MSTAKSMKLKMSKPFNITLVKQLLLDEDKFISDIFSKMPLPANELGKENFIFLTCKLNVY